MATEDEQGGIIFLGEEFEAGGVLERVDGVFLVEANAIGTLQRMKVGQ